MIDFSIVITNYNREKYLDRAIRSCLNQLLIKKTVEVILVDDCSTDNSNNIYQEFKKNIKIIELKKNAGVANASNKGLKKSTGRYWMRVDSDDYLSMHACSIMGMILDTNHQFDYVYCDHVRVSRLGRLQKNVKLDSEEKIYKHGAGILFRKSVLDKIGGYDIKLKNAEDYDLLVRLKKIKSRGFHLPIPLYRYYIHGKNISRNKNRNFYINLIKKRYNLI